MTIAEAEKFYSRDKQQYKLNKNKDFLKWLNNKIKRGYHTFFNIEDLQGIIDNISNWYELKYPERELEFFEGIIDTRFENIKSISKNMNIQQLFFRLPHNQLSLIECRYRANGCGSDEIYNDEGEIIGFDSHVFFSINRKCSNSFSLNKSLLIMINANDTTGKLQGLYGLNDIIKNSDITLDDLLTQLQEKNIEQLEYKELTECVNDHNIDIELRSIIFQLTSLNLLYSKNTIPERGYERAKRFINEFNKKLNLNISSDEIDKLINNNCNIDLNKIKSKKLK